MVNLIFALDNFLDQLFAPNVAMNEGQLRVTFQMLEIGRCAVTQVIDNRDMVIAGKQ